MNITIIDIGVLIVIIGLITSSIFASSQENTRLLLSVTQLLILFILLAKILPISGNLKLMKLAMITIAIYCIVKATIQMIQPLLHGMLHFNAPTGDYINSNLIASFILLLAPIANLPVQSNDDKSFNFVGNVTANILLLILILTWSRGAIISLTVVIIWYILFEKVKRNKERRYILGLAVGNILALIALFIYKQDSFSGRALVMKLTLNICKKNSFFGSGYGSFSPLYTNSQIQYFSSGKATEHEKWLADEVHFAFNEYLQLYIEFGIILVIALIALIIIILKLRPVITGGGYLKYSLGAYFIAAAFSYSFHVLSLNVMLIIFLALISSLQPTLIMLPLSKWKSLIFRMLLSLVLGGFTIYNFASLYIGYKWKKADDSAIYNKKEAIALYETLYECFKHNGIFLFYYGTALHDAGLFKKSATILALSEKTYQTLESNLIQADNYEHMGDTAAITFYNNAINLAPIRLFPKFQLMMYYLKIKKEQKALDMAYTLRGQRVKVQSPDAMMIKRAAENVIIEYDNSHRTKSIR